MGKNLVVIILFVVALSAAAGSRNYQQKWWKRTSSGSDDASSSIISRVSSSIILPLVGNVYPSGFYFAQVNIGQPPRPYFLDPDTGSDLTWLQCDAPCVHCTNAPHPPYRPSNDLVACKDPLCASLHTGEYNCDDPEQCDYEVEYADGGSSLGVLVNDAFSLNLTNGIRINPRLALGCGYDQLPGSSHHPLDGVLGLGRGRISIVSQLNKQGLIKNVVGHCLSRQGGGYLFLGDDVYDGSSVSWTPMSREFTNHYSAGFAELTFGGRSTGIKNLLVIFDSGSSYSYLNSQTYQALLSLVMKELRGKPLSDATEDDTLPVCWKGRRPFKTIHDARQYFKPFALSFSHGWRAKTKFEVPPESYLIISSMGNVCLGVLNGTDVGLQFNLIGDVSMQDKLIIYDNDKKQIGWTSANCDRLPKSNNKNIL